MNLRVNDFLHYMRPVDCEGTGPRYVVEGITDVIDPRHPIVIKIDGTTKVVDPNRLCMQKDSHGNPTISISLSSSMNLFVYSIFPIDGALIKLLENSSLHALVQGRIGSLAVGACVDDPLT